MLPLLEILQNINGLVLIVGDANKVFIDGEEENGSLLLTNKKWIAG